MTRNSGGRRSYGGGTVCGAAVLLAVLCGIAFPVAALTAGPNSPVTVVSDASFGTAAWSDPGNATASDGNYAATTPNMLPTQYLKATNFGFSMPVGATIRGITVDVERSSALETVYDASVIIVKGGTVTGSEHAAPMSSLWPTSDATATYGGTTDLWGTTWTAADINGSGFGVAVSALDSFDVAAVDHITITVTYTVCGDSNIEPGETCDDGNTANGDCCSSTCQFEASGSPCTPSDSNACTDDECDGAGTCAYNNNTDACDDGDPCTKNDACSGGVCAGSGFCLDRFKCYQGKDLKNPKFLKQTAIETDDQLINNQLVDAKKLKYVCAAVDVNGDPIENPNAYLSCYLLKAAQLLPRPNVEVSTQFQMSRFEVKKGKLLCLPSTLTVLP